MAFRNLGLLSTVHYQISKKIHSDRLQVQLRSKYLRHPVICRNPTTDRQVFRQIFIEREYSCLDDLDFQGLILDLGANVGYSSAYFLSNHPSCHVIAVEPDPGNYAILVKNLAPYGERVTTVCGAVWPEMTTLYFDTSTPGSTTEWGRRVGLGKTESSPVKAFDIPSLLAMTGDQRIALLKIDIEGSEKELFARNYSDWLSRTDNFTVELHDDDARRILAEAIAGQGFAVSEFGELTIGKKQR
jgi:FkbM family methyltransferase